MVVMRSGDYFLLWLFPCSVLLYEIAHLLFCCFLVCCCWCFPGITHYSWQYYNKDSKDMKILVNKKREMRIKRKSKRNRNG